MDVADIMCPIGITTFYCSQSKLVKVVTFKANIWEFPCLNLAGVTIYCYRFFFFYVVCPQFIQVSTRIVLGIRWHPLLFTSFLVHVWAIWFESPAVLLIKKLTILFQIELDKNISILKDKEQELEKEIERLSDQQPIDVDEAVTTTAPLYKQYVTQKLMII